MQIKLPPLHPGQVEIHKSPARFKVVCCGRRWGKTRMGTREAAYVALAHTGNRVQWIAPDFQRAGEGFELLWQISQRIPGAGRIKSERRINIGQGMVEVRSADDPDQLRGAGLDLAILDEAAYMPEQAWHVLRPALSDRKGKAIFISTPNGKNWFWRLFNRGLDPLNTDWRSWQKPTSDNPFIDPEEIEQARRDSPPLVFAQEYLAEFTDDQDSVFRHFRNCVYGPLGMFAYSTEGRYCMGVDLAQVADFSVLTVIDREINKVVDLERFNQIDWAEQRRRIHRMADNWHCDSVLVEGNSIGGPNIEALRSEGLQVEAFQTTSESKAELIRELAYALETGKLQIPDHADLLRELEVFEIRRLPSGTFRYSAPSGLHDDCVMSLALAWRAAQTTGEAYGEMAFDTWEPGWSRYSRY